MCHIMSDIVYDSFLIGMICIEKTSTLSVRKYESQFFAKHVLRHVNKSGWKKVDRIWILLVYILILNDM